MIMYMVLWACPRQPSLCTTNATIGVWLHIPTLHWRPGCPYDSLRRLLLMGLYLIPRGILATWLFVPAQGTDHLENYPRL
jgi:hypothetical protein